MKNLMGMGLVAATLVLSGCVVSVGGHDDRQAEWEVREQENRRLMTRLTPGMTVAQVQDLMGSPDFNEYYDNGQQNIQVLFYRSQHLHSDGITTKDECTPLVLKNGVLAAWGESAYQQL